MLSNRSRISSPASENASRIAEKREGDFLPFDDGAGDCGTGDSQMTTVSVDGAAGVETTGEVVLCGGIVNVEAVGSAAGAFEDSSGIGMARSA